MPGSGSVELYQSHVDALLGDVSGCARNTIGGALPPVQGTSQQWAKRLEIDLEDIDWLLELITRLGFTNSRKMGWIYCPSCAS